MKEVSDCNLNHTQYGTGRQVSNNYYKMGIMYTTPTTRVINNCYTYTILVVMNVWLPTIQYL